MCIGTELRQPFKNKWLSVPVCEFLHIIAYIGL